RAGARLAADRGGRDPADDEPVVPLRALVWVGFAFAVVGPLFLTNILWFTAISRVGPSRASLFSNLQPALGVGFAILLLGEHLTRWEVIGGTLILAAVVLERSRRPSVEPPGD